MGVRVTRVSSLIGHFGLRASFLACSPFRISSVLRDRPIRTAEPLKHSLKPEDSLIIHIPEPNIVPKQLRVTLNSVRNYNKTVLIINITKVREMLVKNATEFHLKNQKITNPKAFTTHRFTLNYKTFRTKNQ